MVILVPSRDKALFLYLLILPYMILCLFPHFLLTFYLFRKLSNNFIVQSIFLIISVCFRTVGPDGRLVWAVTTAMECMCLFKEVFLRHWHHLHLLRLLHLHGTCAWVIQPIIVFDKLFQVFILSLFIVSLVS